MPYAPMSDLGQQGLDDITRTLLQQPDLGALSEALSRLVRQSALADNAAIVLWQAQTQRASYYASRDNGTPIKYEDETVLAHGPVRSILSRPEALHCSFDQFRTARRSWQRATFTVGHLQPHDAAGGGRAYFWRLGEFIRDDDSARARRSSNVCKPYPDCGCCRGADPKPRHQ